MARENHLWHSLICIKSTTSVDISPLIGRRQGVCTTAAHAEVVGQYAGNAFASHSEANPCKQLNRRSPRLTTSALSSAREFRKQNPPPDKLKNRKHLIIESSANIQLQALNQKALKKHQVKYTHQNNLMTLQTGNYYTTDGYRQPQSN
jgi:hypothetical protein